MNGIKKHSDIGVNGYLTIECVNEDGSSDIVLDDKNMILQTGYGTVAKSLNPDITSGTKLGVLKFGNDVGNGDEHQPSPPNKDYTPTNQTVVATLPKSEITYISDSESITLIASIMGSEVLEGPPYLKYTSLAIYTDDGQIFSYKRFPFKVISPNVRMNIEWKIMIDSGEVIGGDTPCPIPPRLVGTIIDTDKSTMTQGEVLTIRGYEFFDDNSLKIVRNGESWTKSNDNITLSGAPNGAIHITGAKVGTSEITLTRGDFTTRRTIMVKELFTTTDFKISFPGGDDQLILGENVLVAATHVVNGVPSNVSTEVEWEVSPNLEIVSVTSSGMMIKVNDIGVSTIVAKYSGMVDTFQGTAARERLPEEVIPDLEDLVIDSDVNIIQRGTSVIIRGFEIYSDNSLKVIRNGANWSTDKTGITLTSARNGAIEVTGDTLGTYVITLKSSDVYGDELTTHKTFTVVPFVSSEYVQLEVLQYPEYFLVGEQIVAKATHVLEFVPEDVTTTAQWEVSPNLEIVSIGEGGAVININDVGSMFINATYNEVRGTITGEALLEPPPSGETLEEVIIDWLEDTMEQYERLIIRGYLRFFNADTGENRYEVVQYAPNAPDAPEYWVVDNQNVSLTSAQNGAVMVTGDNIGTSVITLDYGEYSANVTITVKPVYDEEYADIYLAEVNRVP